MINVTKTYLPPLAEYQKYLEQIWESGQITNNGRFLRELEAKLSDHLGAKNVILTANGTLALQIGVEALGLSGKVITTPFSYVATVGSILWQRCEPLFVDVDPQTLCIDPNLIESVIDEDVQAILPVHVFGYPCDVDSIDQIAEKHGLKVLYDAAHAFGAKLKDRSLCTFGDLSVISLHATKLMHSVEGGALITDDDAMAEEIRLLRAFGHYGDDHYRLGTNAKMSELHAAMGLAVLQAVPGLIAGRRAVCEAYDRLLSTLTRPGPIYLDELEKNFAYYPLLFDSEADLKSSMARLAEVEIFPRRYFYPSLNRLPYLEGELCPQSESIAKRIICLPLYPDLEPEKIEEIARILLD